VLTGLAYAAAWIVLPIEQAQPVSMIALIGGMLVVVARLVQLRWM
jgi:hypothetical protein